jgi:hypothetical protein
MTRRSAQPAPSASSIAAPAFIAARERGARQRYGSANKGRAANMPAISRRFRRFTRRAAACARHSRASCDGAGGRARGVGALE